MKCSKKKKKKKKKVLHEREMGFTTSDNDHKEFFYFPLKTIRMQKPEKCLDKDTWENKIPEAQTTMKDKSV